MITITPEGTVLKDGEELGLIDGALMIHGAPISGVVKGQIRSKAGKPELEFQMTAPSKGPAIEKIVEARKMLDDEEERESIEIPVSVTLSDDELLRLAKERGLIPVESPSRKEPVFHEPIPQETTSRQVTKTVLPGDPEFKTDKQLALEALFERMNKGLVTRPPFTSPELGQKAPAFVAWVKENTTPEDFSKIYPRPSRLPTHESHADALARLRRSAKLGEGDKAHEIKF